jgi:hypothetical protein
MTGQYYEDSEAVHTIKTWLQYIEMDFYCSIAVLEEMAGLFWRYHRIVMGHLQ